MNKVNENAAINQQAADGRSDHSFQSLLEILYRFIDMGFAPEHYWTLFSAAIASQEIDGENAKFRAEMVETYEFTAKFVTELNSYKPLIRSILKNMDQ